MILEISKASLFSSSLFGWINLVLSLFLALPLTSLGSDISYLTTAPGKFSRQTVHVLPAKSQTLISLRQSLFSKMTNCSKLCCAQKALAIVQEEMENVQLKECNFKEYGIRTWTEINWNKPLPVKEVGFDVQFTVEQSSLAWSHKFTKVVYEEYLEISWICLVGIIGGTLGLCVGISLLEFGSILHASGKKILSTLKRGIHSL